MSTVFDATYYLTNNPDVLTAYNNGQLPGATAAAAAEYHYSNYGWKELRNPSSGFDTAYYLTTYTDVTTAKTNPLAHFLAYGADEGRAPNSSLAGVATTFNSTLYLSSNADVQAAITAGTVTSAYEHWVLYGNAEGRTAYTTSGAVISGSTSGTTSTSFTLTTALDNLTGTSGNDTFIGDNATLTADVINGGSGTGDKLSVTNSSAAVYTAVPTLSGVETLQVTDAGTAAATFNLVNATGLTKIANVGSTNTTATTFSNVANIVDLEISSTVTGSGEVITYATAAVAGTSDTQNVSISSATMAGLTIEGTETVAFTAASGTSTITTVTDAALTKATFAGAGNLTITDVLTGAATLDASTATGSIKIAADTSKNVTFTGGTGNDTINMGTGLSSADTLNGGDGTDTLRIGTQATYATTAATNVTNFEAVQIAAADTSTLDLSLYGATNVFKTVTFGTGGANNVGVTAANTVAITKGVTGSTINVDLDSTGPAGTVTYALASDGTADTLTLALRNTDTAGGAGSTNVLTALTAATIEELTITSNQQVVSGTTFEVDILNVATLSAAAATKLTITGNSAVIVGDVGSTLTALATVDASTTTKSVTLGTTGHSFNTSVTGAAITTGSGDDSVFLDVGAAGVLKAVDLGANVTTGDTLTLTSAAGAGLTIIDLSSTTDQISQLLASANSVAQLNIENVNLSAFAATTATSQITGSSGANVIVGAAGTDSINGGAGSDNITGGVGADSMTGGSGADTFVFATLASGVTLATADTIVDFTTASDKISTGLAGATEATIADGSGLAAGADSGQAAFITAADAVLTGGVGANDGIYVAYNVAGTGNAYVVIDHNDSGGVNAGDTLIVLTGVDLVTEIVLADFI